MLENEENKTEEIEEIEEEDDRYEEIDDLDPDFVDEEEDAGDTNFVVDLTGVGSKEDLHDRLAEALPLPDYYGRNLDALYDVLTESGDGWHVVFTGSEYADDSMKEYIEQMLDVFEDASGQVDDLTYVVDEDEEDMEE